MDLSLTHVIETVGEQRDWLAVIDGMDTCRPVVLDLSSFTFPDADDTHPTGYIIPSGTRLILDTGTGQYGPYLRATGDTQESFTITENGGPAGGKTTVTATGISATTFDINHGDSAATVQAAMDTALGITAADILVTKSGAVYTFTVQPGGQFEGENLAAWTKADAYTGGTSPTSTVANVTQGSDAGITSDIGLLFNSQLVKLGNKTGLVGAPLYWEGVVRVNRLPDDTFSDPVDDDFVAAASHIRFEARV